MLIVPAALSTLGCGDAPPPEVPAPRAPPDAGTPAPTATSAKANPRPSVFVARRPVKRTYFGVEVTDDYEWLEDPKDPEVVAMATAETAAARAHLDGLPERPAVRARVAELLGATSPDWFDVTIVSGTLFALKLAPPKQQPLLVVRGADLDAKDAAPERVIVDPGVIDPSGKTALDFFVPSPDGRLVAVSLSQGGSESGDVHLFEVATGNDKGELVTHVNGGTAGGSVAWNADGSGFYYTRYPRAGERPPADMDFYQQVYFHKLGATEDHDTYALGKEFPRIAEVMLERSDDGKAILASVANGDGGEAEHHVLVGGAWRRLTSLGDEVARATFGGDGRVYGISRKGAPRGKVVAWAAPFDKAPELVLGEGDGVIEQIAEAGGALYTVELVGGPSRVRRSPLGAKAEPLAREASKASARKGGAAEAPTTIAAGARGPAFAELPILPVSSVTDIVRSGGDLLLRNESFVDAPAWYRYHGKEHRLTKTALAKTAPADMSDVEVVRDTCVSKDGTRVPMSILHKKGQKATGDLPTLLTGYGGFGISQKPRVRAWHRVWLDHGGVVAEANLRGGGEMGEDWHRAGKLTQKQNVFDDFAACAQALVTSDYTRPDRLAIMGGSNGGLLMGAEIVQHPELYRAVVAAVGIYDMLRVELTPNGAFNITEYGTVKDEAQFRALYAYSPLHNVKDGVAYPAVLFTTGANDPRVDPFHSRKMVARLQAATSSDRPILLHASSDTGHGMGTPLSAEIEERSDALAFLLHELGVP